MAEFRYRNLNPQGERRNDCVTRAISLASGLPYPDIRRILFHTSKLLKCESKLCPTCYSFAIQEVLGGIPTDCNGMTVGEFADRHPNGAYLVRINGHLTCIIDNSCYDTWDCLDRMCDMAWEIR